MNRNIIPYQKLKKKITTQPNEEVKESFKPVESGVCLVTQHDFMLHQY